MQQLTDEERNEAIKELLGPIEEPEPEEREEYGRGSELYVAHTTDWEHPFRGRSR